MKEKPEEKVAEYPDTPAWTMFFDGPLYQKYDEFMRTKDFSKILLNTKLKLANSHGPEEVSSTQSIDDGQWDKEQEADPTGNMYPYVSEEFYRRVKEDQKRRTRKTRAYILLGLVIMAALAFGTALVIHYFFIPHLEERNPKNFVNVSFSINTTSSNISETEQTTPTGHMKDISNLLDGMSEDPRHHDHALEHEHILNPNGKIFEDHFMTTTGIPSKSSTEHSTTTATTTTTTTTTTAATTTAATSTVTATAGTKTLPTSTKSTVYVLNLKPSGEVPVVDGKPKQYSSTIHLNHMDFFGMDDFHTTTNGLTLEAATDDFFIMGDLPTTTTTTTTTNPTKQTNARATLEMSTGRSKSVQTTTLQKVPSSTSQISTGFTLSRRSSTQHSTSAESSTFKTTTMQRKTTLESLGETSTTVNTTLLASADSPNTTEETQTTAVETTTPINTAASTVSTFSTTTDILQENNSTDSGNNTVRMRDVTSYTFENAKIECIVNHAIRWQSLSVRVNKTWRPLEITLYPSGETEWSKAKTRRHDVTYDVIKSSDGTGSNMTLGLIIKDVQCRDANTFLCTLKTEIEDRVARGKLIVVGKPSQKIKLTFGPSIIENKAFRITASWQGGYPIPWTNMSWTAVDANNNSYNLADYGEYRDYELHTDHHFCQTTLKHSIVVFPKIHLNDTTVIVKPNLKLKKYFVDETMEKYLEKVEPGIDTILVVPLDYCQDGKEERKLPHPYTACSKFLRCLPGDMVVQSCPIGTCFYAKRQECA